MVDRVASVVQPTKTPPTNKQGAVAAAPTDDVTPPVVLLSAKTPLYRYVVEGSFFGGKFQELNTGVWSKSVDTVIGEGNSWMQEQRFDWMSDFAKLAIVIRLEVKHVTLAV